MINLIFLLVGLVVGSSLTFLYLKANGYFNPIIIPEQKQPDPQPQKQPELDRYTRRGVIEEDLTPTIGDKRQPTVTFQCEVGEIEYTSTKSKIEVISVVCLNSSIYNDSEWWDKVKSRHHNKWMESAKIEWIDDTPKKRDKLINDILGDKK